MFSRLRRSLKDLFPSSTNLFDSPKGLEPPSPFSELLPNLQSLLFSSNGSDFSQGIIPGLVKDEDIWQNKVVMDMMLHFLGIGSNLDEPLIITPQQTVQLLKVSNWE